MGSGSGGGGGGGDASGGVPGTDLGLAAPLQGHDIGVPLLGDSCLLDLLLGRHLALDVDAAAAGAGRHGLHLRVRHRRLTRNRISALEICIFRDQK